MTEPTVLTGWSPVEPSAGTFRAVHTRDGVGTGRDGQTYSAANRDDSTDRTRCGSHFYEVQFADGEWILACSHDLGLSDRSTR